MFNCSSQIALAEHFNYPRHGSGSSETTFNDRFLPATAVGRQHTISTDTQTRANNKPSIKFYVCVCVCNY